MQTGIFQAFICYNFDDYGLQLMKPQNQNPRKLEYYMKSHSNYTVIPWSLNQVLVILAVWAGTNPAGEYIYIMKDRTK